MLRANVEQKKRAEPTNLSWPFSRGTVHGIIGIPNYANNLMWFVALNGTSQYVWLLWTDTGASQNCGPVDRLKIQIKISMHLWDYTLLVILNYDFVEL